MVFLKMRGTNIFVIFVIFYVLDNFNVKAQDEENLHHGNTEIVVDMLNEEIQQQTTLSSIIDQVKLNQSTQQPKQEQPRKRKRQGRKRKRRPHAKQQQLQQQQLQQQQQQQEQQTTLQDQIYPDEDPYHTSQSDIIERSTLRTEAEIIEVRNPPKRFLVKNEKIRDPISALEREQQLSEIREKQKQSEINHDKSYRRPYSSIVRKGVTEDDGSSDEGTSATSTSPIDLKNILKQAGGLSLSEILQHRNLSLSDLLKGKQVAIAAIAQPTQIYHDVQTPSPLPQQRVSSPNSQKLTISTQHHILKPESVRRLPSIHTTRETQADDDQTTIIPTIKIKSTNYFIPTITTTHPSDIEFSSEDNSNNRVPPTIPNIREKFSTSRDRIRPIKEVVPGIRPDLSNSNTRRLPGILLNRNNNNNENIKFPRRNKLKLKTTTNLDVDTTTELMMELTEDVDEEMTDMELTTKSTTSTTTTASPTSIKDLRGRLSLRPKLRLSSKLPIISTTTTTAAMTTAPPSISITDVFKEKIKKSEPIVNVIEKFATFEEAKPKNVETIEELFRFKAKLDNEKYQPNTQRAYYDYPEDDLDVTDINPSLFADITSVRTIDDRTDLLELMEDRRIGARLARVLAQRNMSLDELIEHRKRGSSQLHLAEIFLNKSSPSAPDKLDVVTAFDTFPSFNLNSLKSVKPDEIKTDSQGSSYFTSIINIKPTDEVFKEGRAINVETKKLDSTSINYLDDELTSSKSVVSSTVATLPSSSSSTTTSAPTPPSADFNDDSNNILTEIEDIENSLSRVNDILDLELSGHNFMRNSVTIENASMPIGVRSAILASACIVVVSVFIFILIFIVCRWRQRRSNKLEYQESFTTRGHIPILERNASKRSSSPMVFPVPQRCSKLNTMDPNSPEVQDYLYDAMRRPY